MSTDTIARILEDAWKVVPQHILAWDSRAGRFVVYCNAR